MVYRVRVRNSDDEPRNTTWANYVRDTREQAALSQSELARRLDTDRTTVWRWEHGRQQPDSADIVVRFAAATGRPTSESLAAAGFLPDHPTPEPVPDEEIEAILSAKVSDVQKQRMLELLFQMRERDKHRRMEDIRFLLEGR